MSNSQLYGWIHVFYICADVKLVQLTTSDTWNVSEDLSHKTEGQIMK
jgi:hypothetical protein